MYTITVVAIVALAYLQTLLGRITGICRCKKKTDSGKTILTVVTSLLDFSNNPEGK
jgi:hypothetical protein